MKKEVEFHVGLRDQRRSGLKKRIERGEKSTR